MWHRAVSGSLKSQVEKGCLSEIELPSIKVGKLAENSKSRHRLSAWCFHKLWPLSHQEPRKRKKHRETSFPPLRGTLWVWAIGVCKFSNVKFSHVPEIKMFYHGLGEYPVCWETGQKWLTPHPPYQCPKSSGSKQCHIVQSGASGAWSLGKGGPTLPIDNQCNRPLPQQTSRNNLLAPSLPNIENCETSALRENSI